MALSRVIFRVNEMAEKKVPTRVEPSFGILHILYALREHSLGARRRELLALKSRIAPFPVTVLLTSTQLNGVALRTICAHTPSAQTCPLHFDKLRRFRSFTSGFFC